MPKAAASAPSSFSWLAVSASFTSVAPAGTAAARAARGEVLVFSNDDVVLAPGAVARLVAALEATPDAGVVGPEGATWNRETWQHEATVHAADGELAPCDAVSGYLFATRRETWAAVGGFDAAYAPAASRIESALIAACAVFITLGYLAIPLLGASADAAARSLL